MMVSKRGFKIREGICNSNLHKKANWGKDERKKRRVYMGFMDLEKAYDSVVLCQVLRTYDVGSKLLSEIHSLSHPFNL